MNQFIEEVLNHTGVIYDIETSGLDKASSSILSLSAIKFNAHGDVTATFDRFIHFDGSLPDKITELTGITSEKVNDPNLPSQREVVAEFDKFISDVDFVGGYNNYSFDEHFLTREGSRLKAKKSFDVYRLMQFYNPFGKTPNLRLESFAPLLGINVSHESLADCYATFRLLQHWHTSTLAYENFGNVINVTEGVLSRVSESANNRFRLFPGTKVKAMTLETAGVTGAHPYSLVVVDDASKSLFSDYQPSFKSK